MVRGSPSNVPENFNFFYFFRDEQEASEKRGRSWDSRSSDSRDEGEDQRTRQEPGLVGRHRRLE